MQKNRLELITPVQPRIRDVRDSRPASRDTVNQSERIRDVRDVRDYRPSPSSRVPPPPPSHSSPIEVDQSERIRDVRDYRQSPSSRVPPPPPPSHARASPIDDNDIGYHIDKIKDIFTPISQTEQKIRIKRNNDDKKIPKTRTSRWELYRRPANKVQPKKEELEDLQESVDYDSDDSDDSGEYDDSDDSDDSDSVDPKVKKNRWELYRQADRFSTMREERSREVTAEEQQIDQEISDVINMVTTINSINFFDKSLKNRVMIINNVIKAINALPTDNLRHRLMNNVEFVEKLSEISKSMFTGEEFDQYVLFWKGNSVAMKQNGDYLDIIRKILSIESYEWKKGPDQYTKYVQDIQFKIAKLPDALRARLVLLRSDKLSTILKPIIPDTTERKKTIENMSGAIA